MASDTPRLRELSERPACRRVPRARGHRHPLGDLAQALGKLFFNPISALTHASLVDIVAIRADARTGGADDAEAQAIGDKLGVRFLVSLEKRIAGARAVGAHKTSMLQDVEAGRPLELDALVAPCSSSAAITDTPTPQSVTALYACASLLAKTLREQQGRLRIETAG